MSRSDFAGEALFSHFIGFGVADNSGKGVVSSCRLIQQSGRVTVIS